MKLVILNGSSCSGKSTIIEKIMNKSKLNFFYLSYDSLKWLFSKYQPQKDHQDVENLVLCLAKKIISMKYNIISDSFLYKSDRKKLISLAKKANYQISEINLEANYEVLLKRFRKRVSETLAGSRKKISNLSELRFKELYSTFLKERNSKALSFRTDLKSAGEIANNILESI